MHAGLPTVQTITCLLSCGLFNQGWLPCKCRTNKSQGSSRTSKQVWLISSSTDLSRGRPALPEARAWRLRTDRLTRNAPVSLTSWLRGGQGVSATICRRLTRSKFTDCFGQKSCGMHAYICSNAGASFASFCTLLNAVLVDLAVGAFPRHRRSFRGVSTCLGTLLSSPACTAGWSSTCAATCSVLSPRPSAKSL